MIPAQSTAIVAVIGLGYVGLPLAVEFGKKRAVVGFDINQKRIDELKSGHDHTLETETEELCAAKHLRFSTQIEDLRQCNCFIVTVPTPIDAYKRPDLTPLIKASETVGKALKAGDIVIYESTVYPGCTEEDCVPVLGKFSGLKFNRDFFCGYSSERINPGDKEHRLPTIKKVTSGSTPEVTEAVDQLYKQIITAGTHKASSIKVAEAEHEYGLQCLSSPPQSSQYAAIILAVGHHQFVALGEQGIKALGQPGAVLFDVKSILPLGAADGRL